MFVAGLPVYFHYQYYLKPIVGSVSLSRTDKQVDFSVLGTKSNSTDIKYSRSDLFYGLGLGFVTKPVDAVGSKHYAEFSLKKISDEPRVLFNAVLGVQIGF